MIKQLVMVCLAFSASATINAQKSNVFLGQKHLLEANYSMHYGLLSGETYNERRGSILVQKNLGFQHGLQLAFTTNLSRMAAFGLEFDYGKTMYAPSNFNEYVTNSNGPIREFIVEKIDVNYLAFIGKFEFRRKEGIFPIGVSHQLGAGLLMVFPGKKNGTIYAQSTHTDGKVDQTREIDYNLGSVMGFTGFYNLNFRTPLSDKLMLNFGFRYNVNYLFSGAEKISTDYINDSRMAGSLNKVLGMNVMRFYTGVAYSF